MNPRDQQRIDVLARWREGSLTVAEASALLGTSERTAWRLAHRFATLGVEGIVHGNRGRASPRRLPAATRERIVALAKGRYRGVKGGASFECCTGNPVHPNRSAHRRGCGVRAPNAAPATSRRIIPGLSRDRHHDDASPADHGEDPTAGGGHPGPRDGLARTLVTVRHLVATLTAFASEISAAGCRRPLGSTGSSGSTPRAQGRGVRTAGHRGEQAALARPLRRRDRKAGLDASGTSQAPAGPTTIRGRARSVDHGRGLWQPDRGDIRAPIPAVLGRHPKPGQAHRSARPATPASHRVTLSVSMTS
jgi:hypothetical protein